MNKNLYIFPVLYRDIILSHLNLIAVKKNLYRNSNIFILFLTDNSIYIKNKIEYTINEEIIKNSFNDYYLEAGEDIKEIYPILNNLTFENIYCAMFFQNKIVFELFLKYIEIDNYKKMFLNSFIFSKELFNSENYNEISIDFNLLNKFINREVIKTVINSILFNYINNKGEIEVNNNLLLYFLINENFKNLKSTNIIKFFSNQVGYYIYAYKIQNEDIYSYENIYMRYDIYERIENNNFYQYKNLKEFSNNLIEYKGEKYLVEKIDDVNMNDIIHNIEIEECNKKLCECILSFSDIFSPEKISFFINKYIYDLCIFNEGEEILEFNSIKSDFHFLSYLKKVLRLQQEEIIPELLSLTENISNSYIYKNKQICKCPYCINGYIHETNKKVFCSNCNFFLIKKRNVNGKDIDMYNIPINSKNIKQLLSKKYGGIYQPPYIYFITDYLDKNNEKKYTVRKWKKG